VWASEHLIRISHRDKEPESLLEKIKTRVQTWCPHFDRILFKITPIRCSFHINMDK
jgi:hypothetical protein